MPNFEIPTLEEIRAAIRDEMQIFVSAHQSQPQTEPDEIGGVDLAVKITGKAKPTIYSLCHARLIPHSKQGKQLYFSRKELTDWLKSGKRKTQSQLALDAENFSPTNSRQSDSFPFFESARRNRQRREPYSPPNNRRRGQAAYKFAPD